MVTHTVTVTCCHHGCCVFVVFGVPSRVVQQLLLSSRLHFARVDFVYFMYFTNGVFEVSCVLIYNAFSSCPLPFFLQASPVIEPESKPREVFPSLPPRSFTVNSTTRSTVTTNGNNNRARRVQNQSPCPC